MVLTTEDNSGKIFIPKYKELKAVLQELQSPNILSNINNDDFLKYCKPTYVNGYRNEYNLDNFGVYYSIDKGIRFLYRPTEIWLRGSEEINYDLIPRYGVDFYIKACNTFKKAEDIYGFVERLQKNVSSTLVHLLSSNKVAKDNKGAFIRTFRGFGFIEDLHDEDYSEYIKLSIEQVSKKALKESLSVKIPETIALMANKEGRYSDIIENSIKEGSKQNLLSTANARSGVELSDLFEALLVSGSVLGKEFDEKLLDDVLGNSIIEFKNSYTFGKYQKDRVGYSIDLLTKFDNSGLISQITSNNIKRIKKTIFKNNSVEDIIESLSERGGSEYFVENILKPIGEDKNRKVGVFLKRNQYSLKLIENLEKFGVEYQSFGVKPTRTDIFDEFRQDIDKLMNQEFLDLVSNSNFKQKILIPPHTKTYLVSIMKLRHIDDKYVKVIEEKFTEKEFEKSGKFAHIKRKLKDGFVYLIE